MCSMLQQVQEDSRPLLAAERIRCWFAAESARESSSNRQRRHDHDAAAGPALRPGPIPLDELAQRLGIRIASFNPATRPGVQGYLEPGENIIFLSAHQPEAVRRFTLAHELGHAALHRSWGLTAAIANGVVDAQGAPTSDISLTPDATLSEGCDAAALDAPLDIASAQDETLRPGQAYSAAARRENEANAFAAALLLPTDALLDAYLSATPGRQRRRGTDRVRTLSAAFGVTEDTALRRLAETLADLPLTQLALRPGAATEEHIAGAVDRAGLASVASDSGASPSRLDAEQTLAAQAPTPALVIAGPGAGKTTALLGRIIYLVRERHAPPENILALTFSHRAARELQDRLALALPGADATGDVPSGPTTGPTVNTIHGFCGEVLRMYGPLVGLRADYRLVNEVEGYFLLRELARDLPLVHYQPLAAPTLYYADLLSAISRAKDELADPARYQALATAMLETAQTPEEQLAAERANEIASVYSAYQAALAARGDPDFGDIIRLTVQLLHEQPDVLAELRGRYQHLLVDEFQDINRAMGVLLRTLAGPRGPIWAVGDADQAIYRFRGAAPANLARFTQDYADAHVVTLRRNYRSQPPILEAAASVAQSFLAAAYPYPASDADAPASVGATLIPTRTSASGAESGAIVTLAVAPDEAAETAGLVTDIQRRIRAGQTPGDIAVLCRTRRQVTRIVAELRRAGVATQAPTPLFEQALVKDVLATLALLADSSGSGLLRAGALSSHPFTHADALALLRHARARHITPLAALRSLSTLPPAPATTGNAAAITESADAPTEGEQPDAEPTVSPEGRAGLTRLSDILSELRRAPNVATGLARYVFSLTDLGERILSQVVSAATRATEHSMSAGVTGSELTHDDARREALLIGRLLLLARAYDTQRAAEAQRARNDAEAPTRSPTNAPEFADWGGFLDYIRTLISLGQTGGADDPLAAEAVRVLTVHGSKGLEFPVVYLPGLVNRRFPMQRQRDVTPIPSGLTAVAGEASAYTMPADGSSPGPAAVGADSSAFANDGADTHLLEEACLFYVAMTRARDELVLSYARRYGRAAYHPSPFLAPIERRLASRLARVNWRADPSPDAFTSMRPEERSHAPDLQPTPISEPAHGARAQGLATDADDSDEQNAPPTITALETYVRCPQQYAYRYLYGLGGQRLGMASLRQGLRETLLALHERFDAALASPGEASAEQRMATVDDVHLSNHGDHAAPATRPAKRTTSRAATSTSALASGYIQPTLPSLEDARDLFDERWRQALGDTSHEATPTEQPTAADPLYAIYQRQGRRIAARLWDDLMRQRGLNSATDAPATVRAHIEAPQRRLADGEQAAPPGALAASDGLRRGDMRVMTVRIGEQEVAGALDHVEGLAVAASDPDAPEDATPALTANGPVRFVRYRASGADDPTLSDLFYTLVAQQIGAELGVAGAVEARHYSLTTGDSAPITLTPRQRERLERDLDTALAGLARGDFAPRPEPRKCQGCPYLLICPA